MAGRGRRSERSQGRRGPAKDTKQSTDGPLGKTEWPETKHRAKLISDELGLETPVPITVFPFEIGRHPDNDLVLPVLTVSSYHLCLERTTDGLAVVDVGSRCGITINKARVQGPGPHPIRPGDVIRIGTVPAVLMRRDTPM